MPKAFLIFSHELTKEQANELREKWEISHFAPLPEKLKGLWSNIPPELEEIKPHLLPILQWLERESNPKDIALIQGDPGAVYITVNKAFELGLIPIYATTKRIVRERKLPDGTVQQIRVFTHNKFRIYGR
ncbi:CRISPR-associated protein Csx20 [Desulfurobacterium sp.]|uniref:CRISPR-associated protein Csx20 n=1 Tax=Desulfurobacterium sp. TaxID=2004706 RepID=UPI002612C831|nr:CRISPR-associated protein Csx20 [Desulfurobacterium sp.]